MLYEISEKAIQLENEGKKIIKFNLGDPDQPTPHEIIEAAFEAMKQGKTKYSSSAGEKTQRRISKYPQCFCGQRGNYHGFKVGNFLHNVFVFEKGRKRCYSIPSLD